MVQDSGANRYPLRIIDGVNPFEVTLILRSEDEQPADLTGATLKASACDVLANIWINFAVQIFDQSVAANKGMIKLVAAPTTSLVPIVGQYKSGLPSRLTWDLITDGAKKKPVFLPSPVIVERSPTLTGKPFI
jgi:hypothetical protein